MGHSEIPFLDTTVEERTESQVGLQTQGARKTTKDGKRSTGVVTSEPRSKDGKQAFSQRWWSTWVSRRLGSRAQAIIIKIGKELIKKTKTYRQNYFSCLFPTPNSWHETMRPTLTHGYMVKFGP